MVDGVRVRAAIPNLGLASWVDTIMQPSLASPAESPAIANNGSTAVVHAPAPLNPLPSLLDKQ